MSGSNGTPRRRPRITIEQAARIIELSDGGMGPADIRREVNGHWPLHRLGYEQVKTFLCRHRAAVALKRASEAVQLLGQEENSVGPAKRATSNVSLTFDDPFEAHELFTYLMNTAKQLLDEAQDYSKKIDDEERRDILMEAMQRITHANAFIKASNDITAEHYKAVKRLSAKLKRDGGEQ
jgi:hypothetical protein